MSLASHDILKTEYVNVIHYSHGCSFRRKHEEEEKLIRN